MRRFYFILAIITRFFTLTLILFFFESSNVPLIALADFPVVSFNVIIKNKLS